jgi:hypothetical protein
VIGDRQGLVTEVHSLFDQFPCPRRTVKEGVIRVTVQLGVSIHPFTVIEHTFDCLFPNPPRFRIPCLAFPSEGKHVTANWAPYYGTDTHNTYEIYVELRRPERDVHTPLGPYVPPETIVEFASAAVEMPAMADRPQRLLKALESRGVRQTRLPNRPLPGRGHHPDRLRPKRGPLAKLAQLAR